MDDVDPRQYLQTEARIISESDLHVVLAIRVEKSWLMRNLLFLAALGDCTPAHHLEPAELKGPP